MLLFVRPFAAVNVCNTTINTLFCKIIAHTDNNFTNVRTYTYVIYMHHFITTSRRVGRQSFFFRLNGIARRRDSAKAGSLVDFHSKNFPNRARSSYNKGVYKRGLTINPVARVSSDASLIVS